jgi:hypothetical protein
MGRQGGGTPTFQRTKILARCLCVCPATRRRIAVRATAILIGLGSHCIACHGVAAAAAGEGPVATAIGGRKRKTTTTTTNGKGAAHFYPFSPSVYVFHIPSFHASKVRVAHLAPETPNPSNLGLCAVTYGAAPLA